MLQKELIYKSALFYTNYSNYSKTANHNRNEKKQNKLDEIRDKRRKIKVASITFLHAFNFALIANELVFSCKGLVEQVINIFPILSLCNINHYQLMGSSLSVLTTKRRSQTMAGHRHCHRRCRHHHHHHLLLPCYASRGTWDLPRD